MFLSMRLSCLIGVVHGGHGIVEDWYAKQTDDSELRDHVIGW